MIVKPAAEPGMPDQHVVMPSDLAAWKFAYVREGKLRALEDRVIVAPVEVPRQRASGLLLPDIAEWETRSIVGDVVSTGPRQTSVVEGDRVLHRPWAGTEIHVAGARLIVLANEDVFAVLPDDDRSHQ